MSSQIQKRIDSLHWNEAEASLSARGYAVTDQILTPEECASIVSLYNEPARFRSQRGFPNAQRFLLRANAPACKANAVRAW